MFTILFLSANPAQTDPLDLIKECNLINQKLDQVLEENFSS